MNPDQIKILELENKIKELEKNLILERAANTDLRNKLTENYSEREWARFRPLR